MIDLLQCHWVTDPDGRLFLASAPSLRAPFRFDCHAYWPAPDRRLRRDEAMAIYQSAIEAGMRPMTFLNASEGIACLQAIAGAEPLLERRAS